MNEHDATETAYNNGYKKGVKDLAKKLKAYLLLPTVKEMSVVTANDIDNVAQELTEGK